MTATTVPHLRPTVRRPSRLRRVVVTAVVAVLTGCWYVTLAPTSIGGPLSFVVVSGTSMQPLFHTGDLVIAHRQPSYHLGEIAVEEVDGGRVIHQLWSGNARTGWHTKGINRTSPDSWTIPNRHILGEKWILLPGAARWARLVRTPIGLGAVFGLLAFLVVVSPSSRRRSRRRLTLGQHMKHTRRTLPTTAAAHRYRPSAPKRGEPALLGALGLATTAGVVLAGASSLPKKAFLLLPYRVPAGDLPLAWAATAAGAALCALLAARVYLAWGGSRADRAVARFRDRLVQVDRIEPAGTVTAVASARDLAKAARVAVAPVLHLTDGVSHTFAVVVDDLTYLLEYGEPLLDGRRSRPGALGAPAATAIDLRASGGERSVPRPARGPSDPDAGRVSPAFGKKLILFEPRDSNDGQSLARGVRHALAEAEAVVAEAARASRPSGSGRRRPRLHSRHAGRQARSARVTEDP